MIKLSEEQYYKIYERLDKDQQRKALQCVGADIGTFVGKFDICDIACKKLMALKIEATICKESLEKYVDMLSKLRGDTKMSELKLIHNELVPVYETSTGEKVVYGSELHLVLESKQDFSTWIKRRFNDCEAIENEDYTTAPQNYGTANGGYSTRLEYIIKLDTAKEMAMLERNEKGKEVRKYFIEIEKKYKTNNNFKVPKNYIQALEILLETEKEKQVLTERIEELKPKADYTDLILRSKSLLTISQIAKDYGMSGTSFNKLLHDLRIQYKIKNQWLLYAKYDNQGYVHSYTYEFQHTSGEYEVFINTQWTQKGRLFLYEILKKHEILPSIERVKV